MSMNETPSGERIHIGIFGRRNAGKSSLLNALTAQELAIVSDTPGTTTDPVKKAMELLPLGPVVLIDTPGLDDEGELGKLRVDKALEALRQCNMALVVVDEKTSDVSLERELVKELSDRGIPYIVCLNKCDTVSGINHDFENAMTVSCLTKEGINELKNRMATMVNPNSGRRLVGDLIETGDVAVLVVPIDSAAPKGRLILPQQQTIRDILESGGIPVVTRETELAECLTKLAVKPKLVITDSQAFAVVSKIVPEDIYLTSFSILMSRYKGDLGWQTGGAYALENLKEGASILISEGCTHHRQCGDIGTVKLPAWIKNYTGKNFDFHFTSGGEFPKDLTAYSLIIHCGGCTLNDEEMKYRIKSAQQQNVPITNYGIAISYMNGILKRSTAIFS